MVGARGEMVLGLKQSRMSYSVQFCDRVVFFVACPLDHKLSEASGGAENGEHSEDQTLGQQAWL